MPQTSLESTYLQQLPRLYSVAVALLQNVEDAEDAVQDTYVRLWQRADRGFEVTDVERGEAYLFTTLRNLCYDRLRERQLRGGELQAAELTDDAAELAEDLPSDQPSSQPSFWNRLLARLQPKAARIFRLRHLGELSTHDIAQLTGETESNVRSTLSRARQQLKAEYRRALNDE